MRPHRHKMLPAIPGAVLLEHARALISNLGKPRPRLKSIGREGDREIGQVLYHPAMPYDLSQELAEVLCVRGYRGVQDVLYLVRVHGDSFLIDDVHE